jgi:hypothetical protein
MGTRFEASKRWWKAYLGVLGATIVRTPENVQPIHDKVGRIAKWWLDVVPKVLLAAGLSVAARNSDSMALALFAAVTTGALFAWLLGGTNRYQIQLAPGVASPRVTKVASVVFTLLITVSIGIWAAKAFEAIVGLFPALKAASM